MLPSPELHSFVNKAADEALNCLYAHEEVKAAIGYEKTLIFTEYQYGDHIPGTCYRKRKDCDLVKEWGLFYLRIMLIDSYNQQRTETSSDSALVWAIETRVELETMKCDPEDLSAFFHFVCRRKTTR
jgi:hypothetical protein